MHDCHGLTGSFIIISELSFYNAFILKAFCLNCHIVSFECERIRIKISQYLNDYIVQRHTFVNEHVSLLKFIPVKIQIILRTCFRYWHNPIQDVFICVDVFHSLEKWKNTNASCQFKCIFWKSSLEINCNRLFVSFICHRCIIPKDECIMIVIIITTLNSQ